MSAVYIGTSGWSYDGWKGPFYSEDVPKKDWLRWYGLQFDSTEVNGSFYRTPSLESVRAWRDQTPEGFVFSWKASKFITHWKRLGPTSRSSVQLMNTRLRALGHKLGPVLFQLPARFKADRDRLARFLKILSPRKRYAFEFREASWYETPILKMLREHNVALCLSDHHDAPAPWEVTADFAYVRGHGPSGEYKDRYPPSTMREWAKAIRQWRRRGIDVFCYFDNDQKSAAPKDAKQLRELTAVAAKSA
jgi:uncharacterized protein YecE (DUF72 family)